MESTSKETMLLYLLQLNTTLSVLIRIFMTETESHIIITEARACIVKQISLCMDGLEEVLMENSRPDDSRSGFIKFMDLALDKLAEIEIEKGCQDAMNIFVCAKAIIEEVLCHAMSIAQVALKEDCISIKGCSKEVLNTLESLSTQINKSETNFAMCNLFVDACCDKLCALERKVNTAVLKLSLKVFSECTKPLEDLQTYCLKNRYDNEEVLDELIADFDLHVDRMIQVGLFAVTCSTDSNCILKMRSCLASLEALEGELVPALTTMHNDPNQHNLYFSSILQHYWTQQALLLKKYIYYIIDPFAFCQVTYEVIKEINEDLEEMFKTSACVDKNLVKPITLQTKILFEMLVVSLKDSPPENEDTIRKYLKDVISVTGEIDAAAEKLLCDKDMCKENVFRVFKRCKIQENILKKLLSSLGETSHDTNDDEVIAPEKENIVKDVSKEDKCLSHIMTRGKQILKDRSVLYKTPIKNIINCGNLKKNSVPLSRLVHLRNMQFSHSRISNETSIDLQITDILDNLTTLSGSFAK